MTPNYADLIARLKQKQTDLGDPRDVLMTPRAQEAFFSKQVTIASTISTLANAEDLDEPLAKLADVEERRGQLLAAQVEIERQIEESPDWRLIEDNRERDRAWARMQDLLASRKAIVTGVEYMSGWACVPTALKRILGVVVAPDGRELPVWYGSLSELDAEVARWTPRRDAAQSRLDAAVAEAARLLADPVTS